MKYGLSLMLSLSVLSVSSAFSQSLSPRQIVEKAYYNERSDASNLTIVIEVIRPSWSRELVAKTWAMGPDYGMMLITGPAKDQGVSFLRIKLEGWNWLPTIERVVKISPSQMSQSWMGSDFSNEDLLKEASIIYDYQHELLGEKSWEGTLCYQIQATPEEGAAVVWGKKIIWIGKEDLLERKTENYDEEGTLISTLTKSDIKPIGGKPIPTRLTMVPHQKEGHHTVVTISEGDFSASLDERFFTQQNMKILR